MQGLPDLHCPAQGYTTCRHIALTPMTEVVCAETLLYSEAYYAYVYISNIVYSVQKYSSFVKNFKLILCNEIYL